jgi:hypothetical protein
MVDIARCWDGPACEVLECTTSTHGRAEVAVGSDDDSIGIWATIVWTILAFGVVALIALYSKFPG